MTIHETMQRLYDAVGYSDGTRGTFNKKVLSRELGVCRQHIYYWEKNGLPREFAVKAAEIFGCSADWIIFGKKQQFPAEIQTVINIMMNSDERGREKILIAAKDANDAHQAFLKAIQPSLNSQQLAADYVRQRAQTALKEISDKYTPLNVSQKNQQAQDFSHDSHLKSKSWP